MKKKTPSTIFRKIPLAISLLKNNLTGWRSPLIVNWAITGNCNLRCRHCYGNYGSVQKNEISFENIITILDQLKKAGTNRITLEGGEPLVRKDIDQILRAIKARKIEQSLCTNGVFLSKHIEVVKECVDLVVLSLDGNESYHNWLRGEGNYEKVIDAAKLARKEGLRVLFFCCLIDNNINDIDFLVQKAIELDVKITFNIAVSQLTDNDTRTALEKKSSETYKIALEKIIRYKKEGAPIYYSDHNFQQALSWGDFSKETILAPENGKREVFKKEKHLIPCKAGKNFCYIECNGDVYPCYQRVGTISAKNVITDGVKTSFKNICDKNRCIHCYNLTLSELNLQSALNLGSVLKAAKNYF